MKQIERRLEKIEDRVRCPIHRTRYCCSCQAREITDAEGERFDAVVAQAQITWMDLVPAPCPCVCGSAQFCVECQPRKLRFATIRPQLSPEDAGWLEELLNEES